MDSQHFDTRNTEIIEKITTKPMAGGQYSAILKMKKYRTIKQSSITINTTVMFIGQSLEDKVRQTMETNAPVESISPMVYTERKEGVRPDTNIRTDKWEIAQQAMDTIARGMREKRTERMNAQADKPDTKSEINVQQ